GRRVYLSVGRHTRLPRRYRGRDLIWWLSAMGIDQTPVGERGPSRLLPVISGAYGGHTVDFRRFAAEGVTLLGRVKAAHDGVIDFGWIDIPVLDAQGEPLHRHGVTAVPGLYFLGLQWLSKMNSSFLSGVGDDAAVLADHIASRA